MTLESHIAELNNYFEELRCAQVAYKANKKETKMGSKFKIGDRAYSINYGLGLITQITTQDYPIVFEYGPETHAWATYDTDGKAFPQAVNPTLLTLEEARAKGYEVPKVIVKKSITRYALVYPNGDTYSYNTTKASALSDLHHKAVADELHLVKLTGEYEIEE
jgi:hypothetical protein